MIWYSGSSFSTSSANWGLFKSLPLASSQVFTKNTSSGDHLCLQEPFSVLLARVDATRIEAVQRREIGKLLCGFGKDFSCRDIVFFLLESQIITTYWHIESVICLVSENDSQDVYKASFRGSHIYFTNARNEDKLDFSITIDRKTGTISLLGGS
jgi:hypothetical protein